MAKTKPDRSEINQRVLEVARERGLSQADLVRLTGATSPTVNDWFNRGAVPDAATLALFARGTRINGHWLLTGQGTKLPPGEGDSEPDRAFAAGARAVVTQVRRSLAAVEGEFFGARATSLDEAAVAALKVLERTAGQPRRTRRQAPSR